MKIRNRLFHLFLRFTSLFLLLLSGILAIRDGLQIDWWREKELVFFCLLVSLFATVTYYKRILTIIGISLGTFLELFLILKEWEPVKREFLTIFGQTVALVNRYYGTYFSAPDYGSTEQSSSLLFLILLFLGFWMGKGVQCKKKPVLFLLWLIPAFLCGFLVGYAPGMKAVVCLMAGLGILLLTDTHKLDPAEKKAKIAGFLCLVLSAAMAAPICQTLSPKLLQYHFDLKSYQHTQEDKIIEALEKIRFFSQWNTGYGNRTDQARLTNDPPGLSGSEVFSITLKERPAGLLYIRNFVGAAYENGVWYPANETDFTEYAEAMDSDAEEYGRFLQNLGYYYSPGREETALIQTKRNTGNLSLQPYDSMLPEEAVIVGDSGFRMNEKTYECRMRIPVQEKDDRSRYGIVMSMMDPYVDYAKERYTQIPADLKTKLTEYQKEAEHALYKECIYSFDLEEVPKDVDIIEYFLFTQKKGYCMHFASACTLLKRSEGIPARYASGYLVTPGDFEKNEEGSYTAVITGKRAHAWTECYADWGGWYPVDATPGSYLSGILNAEAGASVEHIVADLQPEPDTGEEVPDIPTEEPEETEPPKPVPSEEKTDPEKEPEGNTGSMTDQKDRLPGIVKFCFAVTAAFGSLLVCLYLRRKYIKTGKTRVLKSDDRCLAARLLTVETLELLKLLKFELKEQTDELSFARKTEEKLTCFASGELVRFFETARIVRYGNAGITEEQLIQMQEVYDRLLTYEEKCLKWYQKFWYRYVRVLL